MVTKFKVGDSVHRGLDETRRVWLVKPDKDCTGVFTTEPKVRWKIIKIFEKFDRVYLQCKRMRKRGKQIVELKAEECWLHENHEEMMKNRQQVFLKYLENL
jgi:hypothetical protein